MTGQAPEADRAVIYGQITDRSGAPIPRAQLVLKSGLGERTYSSADGSGCYQLAVVPGDYTISARSQGFRTGLTSSDVVSGSQEMKNIALDIGGCTECVEVQGLPEFAPCITDSRGTPVATAEVTLLPVWGPANLHKRTIKLDDWGCGWTQLTKGAYRLSVTAAGFQPLRKKLVVEPGQLVVNPSKFELIPAGS